MKIGIDIVEISRFSQMENSDVFVKRVFSNGEQEYLLQKRNAYESMAGFYAAKEAYAKYLGIGVRGFRLKDVEVAHDEMGKPCLLFQGKKLDVQLSITHSKTDAVAVVVGKRESQVLDLVQNALVYEKLLPKRWDAMHKGDCGRVFFLAGSVGMTGAAALCGEASLRTGSGLVTVGTVAEAQPVLAVKLTEAMTLPLDMGNPDSVRVALKEQIEKSDAVGIGPGLGCGALTLLGLRLALMEEKPLVIDADGLNVLSEHIDILREKKCPVVLTPHPGEMARLCGKSLEEIKNQRVQVAEEFAKEYGVTLLLKGKNTVIASPDGKSWQNPTGNSGMASGGMGDVLTGMITSLLGQGLDCDSAARLGAYLHGLAGDMAKQELGEFGMIAGDVVRRIPYAIGALETERAK